MSEGYPGWITVSEGDDEVLVRGGPNAIEQGLAQIASIRRWRQQDTDLLRKVADCHAHRFEPRTRTCFRCGLSEREYYSVFAEQRPDCPGSP